MSFERQNSGAAHADRLDLSRPALGDLDELFAILRDPHVWTHFPSRRHTDPAQTAAALDQWITSWDSDGLGPQIARLTGQPPVLGYGGCTLLGDKVWNLAYRFAADAHGHGHATELAREAVRHAERVKPELPVVAAYLLEHNTASERVATKVGMRLVHRGADAGNPGPKAVRLVYASRSLSGDELAVAMH